MSAGQSWYRSPSFWIGLIISIVSLVLLSFLVNVPDLIQKLEQTDLRFVLLGIPVSVGPVYIRVFRWQALLGRDIGFWNVFHAENIGNMLNSILPLRAGEPARAYLLSRAENARSISSIEALSTVVVIRLADTLAAVALLGLVLPTLDIPDVLKAAGYSLLVLATIGFLVLLVGAFARPRLLRVIGAILPRLFSQQLAARLLAWTDSFLMGLAVLRNVRSIVSLAGFTALLWAGYVGFYTVMLMAFWPAPPLAWGTLATCAASLSLAVPSSPGAIGVFHAAVAFAMSPYLTPDVAAAYAIVIHATEIIVVVAFGACSLAATGYSIRRITEQAPHQTDVA